jgi:hypothetical protein
MQLEQRYFSSSAESCCCWRTYLVGYDTATVLAQIIAPHPRFSILKTGRNKSNFSVIATTRSRS